MAQSMLASPRMKLTVCQLHNAREAFAAEWDRLVAHVRVQRSDFVLLPEMPFFPWFPTTQRFDHIVWRAALAAHEAWEKRLSDLRPAVALATRPVEFGAMRYSAGYHWNLEESLAETMHVKTCLAQQDGAWETIWYQKAVPDFEIANVSGVGVGMLIGLELYLSEQARLYGEDGARIVAVPRVDLSGPEGIDTSNQEWLEGGRAAALASGAFCISSSRGGSDNWAGGAGWIVAPDGRTVVMTSSDQPFVTAEVDLLEVRSTRPV
jgi:N-carbamoylputrescine amidase